MITSTDIKILLTSSTSLLIINLANIETILSVFVTALTSIYITIKIYKLIKNKK